MTKQEQNKTQSILAKIKAFVIGYIGAGIFAMGTGYFQEQSSYHIPRILLPVYNLFGNIGLAIGMVILGLLLMYWSVSIFKAQQGKTALIIVVLFIFTGANYGFIWLNARTKAGRQQHTVSRTEQDIQNADRPKIDHAEANTYLDKLERLAADMQSAKTSGDAAAMAKAEEQYVALTEELSKLIPVISRTEVYRDFILYNAKVSEQINQLRRMH